MPYINFWDYILSPTFLITFGLVGAGFLPLLWGLYVTWRDNPGEREEE